MDGRRERKLEDWVELAAAAVERARRSLGDDEVARRVAAGVTDDEYDTVVRVLRTMGRDLQASAPDLTTLDARLRAGHVEQHPHVPEAPEDAASGDAAPAEAAPADAGASGAAEHTAGASEPGLLPGGRNPEPTLDDLPAHERGAVRPAELAKKLARLRNPILPHPRRGRAT